jgi:hypothetical protein
MQGAVMGLLNVGRITPAHHLRGATKNTDLSAKVSYVSNGHQAPRATPGARSS